ncbi:MAG: hypothetical protein H7122_10855 [Chitinophagaceae bacterium]|nr:hypothetical protein [Chitinophagaceae bacterium]
MQRKIRQIWNTINLGLSMINLFIAILLLGGSGIPDKYKDKKIPLTANIFLLLILVSILLYCISSYGDNTEPTSPILQNTIAAKLDY